MSQEDDYNIAEAQGYDNDNNDYPMYVLQTQDDQKEKYASGSSQVNNTDEVGEFKDDIESSG